MTATLAFDARFLLHGEVHPHSRLVHIFLRQNVVTPYAARIILYTDRAPDLTSFGRSYSAPNVLIRTLSPTGGRFQRLWWLGRSLRRAFKRDAVTIFYSSFYFLPPRCRGVQLINSIHDCCVFYINPKLNRGLLSNSTYLRILKPVMQWTTRRAHATITVSNFSKKMLHQHLGLKPAKIRVCYHGLDEASGDVMDAAGSKESSAEDEPYFLFVGSNLPKKNIRKCIEGFARLPSAIRNRYKLRLKTGCYPEDRAQVEGLGLSDRVEFIERRLDEPAMETLFRNASLLLLLSYDEGFGLPIVEAFAAGVPVLVSNRAACDELVSLPECKADPENTDEIAEKWRALVENEELRTRCLRTQERLLPQFSCRTAADAFYRALIA